MALKNRMLCYVMGTLAAGAAISLALNVGILLTAFPGWIDNVADSMVGAEERNLARISSEKATWTNEFYNRVDDQVSMLTAYADTVMAGDVSATTTTTYQSAGFGYTMSATTGWSSALGGHNPEKSGWWLCSTDTSKSVTCSGVNSRSSLNGASNGRLDKTAALQVAFHAVLSSGFPLGPSFMGAAFHDDGMLISYPLRDLSGYRTWTGTCTDGGHAKRGYDPRCRIWYTDPYYARGPAFTAPYLFAEVSSLGVTVAKTIKQYSGSDFNPAGVIMSDFVITDVTRNVGRTTILQRGYGFLIAVDGSVVVHPNVNLEDETSAVLLANVEFPSPGTERSTYQSSVVAPMLADASGSTSYTKGGETWFVAWQAVPTAGYVLGITVPESDVREPFTTAKSSINSLATGIIIAVVIALGVVLVLSFIYSASVVDGIVRPVQSMVAVTRRINEGKFDAELLGVDANCRELALLFDVFKQMCVVVKFGNSSFTTGDYKTAMVNYEEALQLFSELQNLPGQGVALNNIGNIHFMLKEYDQAINAYSRAVAISHQLLGGAPVVNSGGGAVTEAHVVHVPDGDDNENLTKQLASRQYNLALAYIEARNPEARTHLVECIRSWERLPGFGEKVVASWCALAKVDLRDAQLENAHLAATHATHASRRIQDPATRKAAEHRCLLVWAALAEAEGDGLKALWILTELLSKAGPKVDKRTFGLASQDIVRIGKALNMDALVRKFEVTSTKDVYFCLDNSGSMAGGLNRACVEQLTDIVTNFINDDDRAGLMLFSSRLEAKFPLMQGTRREYMLQKVAECIHPQGTTKFRDAIVKGLNELGRVRAQDAQNDESGRKQWLVVLTDGDDNGSSTSVNAVMAALQRAPEVGLIIIMVGQVASAATVARMCDPALRGGPGVFIHNTSGGSDAVREAFGKVKQMIVGAEISIESYG